VANITRAFLDILTTFCQLHRTFSLLYRLSRYYSVPPRTTWDSSLKYVTTTSFLIPTTSTYFIVCPKFCMEELNKIMGIQVVFRCHCTVGLNYRLHAYVCGSLVYGLFDF
jgi:hypothetical protein